MAKNKVIAPASMLTMQDISAWYDANPIVMGSVDKVFPLEQQDNDTWQTIGNNSYLMNEAADPLSSGSPIPVAGRDGFKTVMGGMAEFGKGREMTSKDLEKFEKLKMQFAATKNPAVAQQLVNFYGNDLAFVRTAMQAERIYLSWALLSNACDIGFVSANSPYLQGITSMTYPIAAWQKNNNSTSWANAAALILDDIQTVKDTMEANGKICTRIKINKTWFNYVRNNTQVQKYCATLLQNISNTQAPPTLNVVNDMLTAYFDTDIQFEVVNESITRSSVNGVATTANPFADGVAVFTAATQVGRFAWNPLYIDDTTRETFEDFFLVGNYKNVDPSYSKIYAKGKGFPVVDTFADNFYLKVNAVAW